MAIELVVQQVPKFVPVAPDLLKAAQSFTLSKRKTGNECRSLTPIVDDIPSKYDRDTNSKTDEKTCPEDTLLLFRTARIPEDDGLCCSAVAILRRTVITFQETVNETSLRPA